MKIAETLANTPIPAGYQAGSHYSTIQALAQRLEPEEILLSFNDRLLFRSPELLDEGRIPAVHLFGAPVYVAEQLGSRKICDRNFMMAGIVNGTAKLDDIRKSYEALKRAQRDIDLRREE